MNILVVGATGYVGSHVARALMTDGHEVTGLVRDPDKSRKLQGDGLKTIMGDVDSLDEMAGDFDGLVFAAQLAHEHEAVVVEKILRSFAGRDKAFVFTSGTAVLSQTTGGDWSEDTFAEQSEFEPQPMVVTRCATERLIRAAADRLRTIIIRPPLVWGNGGSRHVPYVVDSIGRTGSACYIGAGLNLYSHVHIEDLANLYCLAIAKGISGAVYHAVAGEENFRTIADAVAGVAGCSTRSISLAEAGEIWGDYPARIMFNVCSRSQARRSRAELGWSPRHCDLIRDIRLGSYRDLAAMASRSAGEMVSTT